MNDNDTIIAVWRLNLERDPDRVARYRAILSPDELERADRLRSFELRADFVYTRGVLRHVLAPYADVDPAEIQFTYEDRGKPHLIPEQGGEEIGFNISHSRDLSVFAIARNRPVGVDIERIRRDDTLLEVARRFFSDAENRVIDSLPGDQKLDAFFTCWSRKEAVVKALGTGISHSLSSFTVSVLASEPAALVETAWDPTQIDAWSMVDLPLPEGYAGALVASGRDWVIDVRDWTDAST